MNGLLLQSLVTLQNFEAQLNAFTKYLDSKGFDKNQLKGSFILPFSSSIESITNAISQIAQHLKNFTICLDCRALYNGDLNAKQEISENPLKGQ